MSPPTPPRTSRDAHVASASWRQYRLVRQASAVVVVACGIIPMLFGCLALLGWALDLPRLRSIVPGGVEMKANTALVVVLAGAALLLIARGDRRRRGRAARRVAQGFAVTVAAVGAATVAQYLLGVDLRIDQALVRDYTAAAGLRVPGRMSGYSAVALSFIGVALAALGVPRLRGLSVACAGVTAMIGLSMLAVHAWGAARLRTDEWAAPVAFATATAYILLGLGVWLATHRFAPGRRSLRVLIDPIELKILASFIGTIVALTTVGGLMYGAAAEYSREVQRYGQIRQVRANLTELYATIADAVFIQRTLVLTEAGGEGAGWSAQWLAKRAELARARLAMKPHADLGEAARSGLKTLDSAVAGLVAELQQAIEIRQRGDVEAARAFVRSGRDTAAMAELRGAMAHMEAVGRAEEERRSGLLRSGRERTIATTVLALVFAAFVLGAGFVAIRREMTARAGAERALRRRSAEATAVNRFLELLVHNIPHMIFVKDAKNLRFVHLNRAGEELTGWSQASVVGKSDHDLFPREQADFFVAKDREVLTRREIVDIPEERIATVDRGERLLHTKKIPLLDAEGRPTHLLGIAQDVTEARATERKIQQLNDALKERADEVERVGRARATFLATMSHEIRTPMNGMLGMIELLGLGRLDDKQRQALNVVSESGQSLLRIIDDILDFSKIEAEKLELRDEVGSLADIVTDVQDIHAAVANGKGLEILATVDARLAPAVWIDTLRVRQILNNFVSNAVKFTTRGRVDIRVAVEEDGAGHQRLRLSVSDTGVGIPVDQQGRLFEPFVQAGGGTVAGGTGLGLAISRRLAELMGGTVHLASEPGRGTTLWLEITVRKASVDLLPLPIARKADHLRQVMEGRRSAPSVADAAAEGTLVLVVDDHPVNRMLLQQQVESLGYAVETAADGVEALQQWSSRRFALVLTDCQMPRMTGYELARRIRQGEALQARPRTPLVACTAMVLEGETQRCRDAGMDEVVFKPVELQQLLATLQRWVPLSGRAVDVARPPPPPPPAAGASRSTVDTAYLASIWGPDATTVRAIVNAYVSSVHEDHAALLAAVERRDRADVREQAHRMLGASRMVNAAGMAEACALVTAASREGDLTEMDAALAALDAEYERIVGEFGGKP